MVSQEVGRTGRSRGRGWGQGQPAGAWSWVGAWAEIIFKKGPYVCELSEGTNQHSGCAIFNFKRQKSVSALNLWALILNHFRASTYVQKVALLVIDEIHLLGEDRGPVLEVIVSRTNFISSHTGKS